MGNGLTVIREEVWDEFCDNHPPAWFWHTTKWRDYQIARGALDRSQYRIAEGKLIGIAPIFETDGAWLMEGHPNPWPLDMNADIPKGTRAAFRTNPMTQPDLMVPSASFDGWRTWTWRSQVINLHPATLDLWAGVRKSYHALINHVEKTHEIIVDERGKLLDAFRQIHAYEAGRETRPRETWEMMADWCKTGNGLHICAILGGVVVACVYFEVYKGCAYYGHAASYHNNLTHALIWRGMQELKMRGVTQLEMGWLDYPGEEGRAVFKTGFGGEARTIYAVERPCA